MSNTDQKIVVGHDMIFNVHEKDAELFHLSGPCAKAAQNKGMSKSKKMFYLTTGKCDVCKSNLEKKKFSQCDFCGIYGCHDCICKEFPYPYDNHKFTNTGLICLICETKFYLNEFTTGIFEEIKNTELRI